MKIETEIKIAINASSVKKIIAKIEKKFHRRKMDPFKQITHQFFFEDYTKQTVFPRIRNEKDGEITLTIKTKLQEKSEFFKRIETETGIEDAKKVVDMMPFFGFPKKITWEKKRHSFLMGNNNDVCFFLDETPMGWFLEIEAEESTIEEVIIKLGLSKSQRINMAYLGLWEDYKKEHNISSVNMIF